MPVDAVDAAIGFAFALLHQQLSSGGGPATQRVAPIVAAGPNLLDAFRTLARGDPTWNAVRDNLRELIYYRNCIAGGREDALPPVPEKMAIRTARHLYLYFLGRCQDPPGR